jgi:hypothetical protein
MYMNPLLENAIWNWQYGYSESPYVTKKVDVYQSEGEYMLIISCSIYMIDLQIFKKLYYQTRFQSENTVFLNLGNDLFTTDIQEFNRLCDIGLSSVLKQASELIDKILNVRDNL